MQSGEGKNYNGSKKESSKEEGCEESSKENCKEEDYKETIVFSQNSAKAEFCVFVQIIARQSFLRYTIGMNPVRSCDHFFLGLSLIEFN